MIEGNPVRALERGEQTELPSVLYIKAATDVALPRPHADRFICAYRRVVGGAPGIAAIRRAGDSQAGLACQGAGDGQDY